jgi:hypothetical protein
MKHIFFSLCLFAAASAHSQYEKLHPFTYHIGVGFAPYSPPLTATIEVGAMVTSKIYFGAQAIGRGTNAPTVGIGPVFGMFHSWNNNAMHQLTSGLYFKWEYNAIINGNDAFKADPFTPFGVGFRHYAGGGFVDFSYGQRQWNLTLGVKFGRPVYF